MRVGAARLHLVAALAVGLAAGAAGAQDRVLDTREAGKHFDHGVALYGEADYPGALAEFKRAYTLAPNSAVLFNIGEAQYQLQDYAGALASFSRYLVEAPPGASHRADVESDVEVLRSRVGHLTIVTVPPGADVSVDEQSMGKTPLDDRVLVSVGHRKVTAALAGGPATTRYVDVAADDDLSLTLQVQPAPVVSAPLAAPPAAIAPPPAEAHSGVSLRAVGWIATGVLAAGAVSTAVAAWRESLNLQSARATFPVSSSTLQQEADRTRTYSIVADSLGAAAAVVGSVTLVSLFVGHGRSRPTETGVSVHIAPASIHLAVTF